MRQKTLLELEPKAVEKTPEQHAAARVRFCLETELFDDPELVAVAMGSAKDNLYRWLKKRAEDAEERAERYRVRCEGLEKKLQLRNDMATVQRFGYRAPEGKRPDE